MQGSVRVGRLPEIVLTSILLGVVGEPREHVLEVPLPLTELRARTVNAVPADKLETAEVPSPEESRSKEDIVDTIRRLGELRDAGLLTDEEFQTKKQELLDRL